MPKRSDKPATATAWALKLPDGRLYGTPSGLPVIGITRNYVLSYRRMVPSMSSAEPVRVEIRELPPRPVCAGESCPAAGATPATRGLRGGRKGKR